MKVFKITAKNLKLLTRSKTSMFVVIFGPLIIMLLVGFAFNNPSASKLNIGYYANEKTELTTSFLDALKSNPGFQLIEYDNEATCKGMIEQAKVHMCIVFPKDFKVDNNKTNEIVFFVDQSRANFVYAVIDTVSTKISFTSSKLSYQMTNDLLSVISASQKSNNDNVLKIITLKNSLNDLSTKLTEIKTKLNSLDLSKVSVNTQDMVDWTGTIKTDNIAVRDRGLEVVDLGTQLVTDLSGKVSNATILSNFGDQLPIKEEEITNATTKTSADIDLLIEVINTVSSDVTTLNQKLANANTATADSVAKVGDVQTKLDALKTDLDTLKATMEKTNAQIGSLKITSAESIVNPIKTTVTPITPKANNLNFIFPYLIILIIAFISIMLSSNIILMEKTSKAYFRNFTTPTKDFTFIVSVFLTSFLVVILQLIFILLLAYYFLNTSITSNISWSIILIIISITLFTLLGMIIGYMFNSQEAATMASISLGSVFLFLSNLILPLETMSGVVQQAARYNPYVIASELLKKLTLFGSRWNDVSSEFALLGIYIVCAFILVLIVEKMSKIQYISKKPMTRQIVKKEEIVDKYFKLKSGVLIRNETELLAELKKMSDVSFQEYVDNKKNDFESWFLINSKNDFAKVVGKSRNRKEMIDLLEKYNIEMTNKTKKK